MKVTGKLRWNIKGFAFVVCDGDHPDIFIPPERIYNALDGDIVEVVARKDKRGLRGKVVSIIKRANTSITGIYKRLKEGGMVEPYSPFPYKIVVPFGAELDAKDGDIVIAKIYPPKSQKTPQTIRARVIQKLAMPVKIGDDLRSVAIKYGLPWLFPKDIETEAKKVSKIDIGKELKDRQDLRDRLLFTIDSSFARDFDDAVGIDMLPGGTYRLTVAIADVSHLVRKDSLLDKEAFKRSFSIYFPEATIPMLPAVLSNGVMSLKPNEDRLAVAVEIYLGPKGGIINTNIFEAVIRSAARLTYEEIGPFLEGTGEIFIKNGEIITALKNLHKMAGYLYKRRKEKGSLDFDLPEIGVSLDSTGQVDEVFKRERNPACRLIEEAMLIANREVCSFLERHRAPILYRIHEPPVKEDLLDLSTTMKEIGLDKRLVSTLIKTTNKGIGINMVFQGIADNVIGTPIETFVHQQILRALRKARYSDVNMGHFGLAFNAYLHFTSPIRRYPDLVIHRILKDTLRATGLPKKGRSKWQRHLKRIAPEVSQREKLADDAMLEVLKLKKAAYMRRHIGDIFTGIVSSILEFGMFVEITAPPVDGLVPAQDLGNARIIEGRYVKMKKRTITIGDVVRVQVAKVDQKRGFIDLALV